MTAVAGSGQPFQAFLEEHREAVVVFLRGLVGPGEAEDCAQETFLAALQGFPRFDGRHPRAWILAIAQNKATDHWRVTRATGELSCDGAVEQADSSVEPQLPAATWEALSELPENQRAAVVLRYAVDLRYREIGDSLGCSEAAARQRVRSALQALRDSAIAKEVQ